MRLYPSFTKNNPPAPFCLCIVHTTLRVAVVKHISTIHQSSRLDTIFFGQIVSTLPRQLRPGLDAFHTKASPMTFKTFQQFALFFLFLSPSFPTAIPHQRISVSSSSSSFRSGSWGITSIILVVSHVVLLSVRVFTTLIPTQ